MNPTYIQAQGKRTAQGKRIDHAYICYGYITKAQATLTHWLTSERLTGKQMDDLMVDKRITRW